MRHLSAITQFALLGLSRGPASIHLGPRLSPTLRSHPSLTFDEDELVHGAVLEVDLHAALALHGINHVGVQVRVARDVEAEVG